MVFKSPLMLLLLPIILGGVFIFRRRQKVSTFRFPSGDLLGAVDPSWKIRLGWIPFGVRLLALALFVVALAGPRSVLEETVHTAEGVDIVLAIDSSSSMASEDFFIKKERVNRLEIVKSVVKEFIRNREHDRIGLIVFASLAYTVCPLTTDFSWLIENLDRVELGQIHDGTAVGSAIASSVARLKTSDAKSKIIILLTDGVNTVAKVDPISMAGVAKALDIKIYTIGAGTNGAVPYPVGIDRKGRKVYKPARFGLDEEMLKEVAQITDGQYFRATDEKSLREIYDAIDAMEKIEIEEYGYFQYEELFGMFLIAALILLVLEIVLVNTVFFKIP